MASWDEFEQRQPGLATAGHALFYQFGVGLAFLATVRRDGGPRVHPMCPLIHGGGLFAFIVPGPKQADLRTALTTAVPGDPELGYTLASKWRPAAGRGFHGNRGNPWMPPM